MPRRGRPISEAGKFVQDRLQLNPEATFNEIKNVAALSGLTIPTGTYYQARSRLGIAKAARATRGDHARSMARWDAPPPTDHVINSIPEPTELEPARSPAPRTVMTTVDIEAIALAIRELEQERNALRECLSQLAAIVNKFR